MSDITLNSHIEVAGSMAVNMRLFESTGVATCLVTDWKENLSDLFKIDEEVVAYRTPQEAVEKINYLMSHDDVRISIAQAGQKRTLKDHSLRSQIIQAWTEFQSYF